MARVNIGPFTKVTVYDKAQRRCFSSSEVTRQLLIEKEDLHLYGADPC